MTDYVITPAHIPSIAVKGSDARFPLRRVFCVGRNYREHTREMGHDPDREPPFFFMKPADAVVPAEGVIAYPPLTSDLHHEVELVVAIGKGGVDISPEEAFSHIWGYGLGIDLTRRDLQAQAKKFSRPWEWAKAFDESAPSIPLQPVSAVGHPSSGKIWLNVNGEQRQLGDLADQIWSVSEVISQLSHSVTLRAGDLIMTGTPEGVAAVVKGDLLEGVIAGVGSVQTRIV